MKEYVVTYLCPECRRTINWRLPSSEMPNTTCSCRGPESLTFMVQVWPPTALAQVNYGTSVRQLSHIDLLPL